MIPSRSGRLAFQLVFGLTAVFTMHGADNSPEALINADHWKRARATLEAQFAANSNDARTLYLLAKVKAAFNELDPALQLAQKSASLDSRSADTHVLLADIQGRRMEMAGIFRAMGMLSTFKKELNTALALDPNHLDARWEWLGFHLNAPGIAGGDKKKAVAFAEEILRIDAERGYLARAAVAASEKNMPAVEDNYLKALKANPNSYRANLSLANYYSSQPQTRDTAEKYARSALRLDSGRVAAYSTLARIMTRQKHWAELDALLVEAEKNVSDDLTPFYQAGLAIAREGDDFKRAEGYFRKYLTQEPEAGRPSHARAHWQLGLVLEKQSRKPEALAELQTAVRMDPEFEPAKKDLKRLK